MANENNLPAPESRSEELLNRIVQNTAGNGADTPLPDPQSREEQYLAKIAENTAGGGGGGGGDSDGGNGVFWVHVTGENYGTTGSADKSFDEIYAAANSGKLVKAVLVISEDGGPNDYLIFDLVQYNSKELTFACFVALAYNDVRTGSATGIYITSAAAAQSGSDEVVLHWNTFEITNDE